MQPIVLKRRAVETFAAAGVFALFSLLITAPAHAQLPDGEETITQVTDVVKDTGDKVGDTVTDTGGKVGDTVTDTGGKVGDAVKDTGAKAGDSVSDTGGKVGGTVGGTAGDTIKETSDSVGGTIKKTTDGVGSTVKDTSGTAGSTINQATGSLSGETKDVTRFIDKLVGGTGDAIDDLTGKGKDSPNGATDKNGGTAPLYTVPDRLQPPASASTVALTSAPLHEVSTTPAGATSDSSAVADAVRRAIEAIKRFAFPLALTVLVIAYLGVHGWFDRRDPKLALAAVDPEADLLRFE